MLKYILADFGKYDNYWHIMYTDPNILSNLRCPSDYSPVGFVCENIEEKYYKYYKAFWIDGIDHTRNVIDVRPIKWQPYDSKLWELYDEATIDTLKNTNAYVQGGRVSTRYKYDEERYNKDLQLLSQDGNWFVDFNSIIDKARVQDNAMIIQSFIDQTILSDNCVIVTSRIYGCDGFKISGYTFLKNVTIFSLSSIQLYNVSICNELVNCRLIIHIMSNHPNVRILNITFSLNDKTLEYFRNHGQTHNGSDRNRDKVLDDADKNEELGVIEITSAFGDNPLYTVPLSQFLKDFS